MTWDGFRYRERVDYGQEMIKGVGRVDASFAGFRGGHLAWIWWTDYLGLWVVSLDSASGLFPVVFLDRQNKGWM